MPARDAAVAALPGGVHRVTLPLPWALDHVHCYAIEDADGWTIVDSGLGAPGTLGAWRRALDGLGRPRVRRLVLTHFHPDHVGASRALAELAAVPEVVQGRVDATITRRVWAGDRDSRGLERYLRRLGMPPVEARSSTREEGRTPVDPASPTRLVDEGDTVEIAGEAFRVLELPGHADGHIALLGERSRRLFGGDVLLLGITPNVGRWEDTLPDPLARYLRTLERLERLRPAVVYPGHRGVIADAAGRAAEIRAHHALRLEEHLAALAAGAETPYAVSRAIWGDGLGLHERRFALVEAAAHLERLAAEGRAVEVEPGRWRRAS